MGETTRRFRRRLDDRPLRVWSRRAFWFAFGAVTALAYSAIATWCVEHMHRVPR